jgi:hypothetical protein
MRGVSLTIFLFAMIGVERTFGSPSPDRNWTDAVDRESVDNLRDRSIPRSGSLAGLWRWLFVRLDGRNAKNTVAGIDEEHFPGHSRR